MLCLTVDRITQSSRTLSLLRTFIISLTPAIVVLKILSVAHAASLSTTPLSELVATNDFQNGLPEQVHPGADGTLIYFLRSGPKDTARCLYLMNTVTGITRRMVGPTDLGTTNAGLTSFQVSNDGKEILVPYYGKVFLIRVADRRLLSFAGTDYINPVLSPDGSYVAAIRNDDLIVINVSTGAVKALTFRGSSTLTHGLSDLVDQRDFGRTSGFWWSPDSRRLVFVETDSRPVVETVAENSGGPMEPPSVVHFPFAGTPNADVRLGIVSIDGAKPVWVRFSSEEFPYVVRVIWRQERAPLSVVLLSRNQHSEELLTVSPQTGTVEILLQEFDTSWVSTTPDFARRSEDTSPYWLSDGSGFLWLSENNGDWQIEIRDRTGLLIRTATPLGLHVRVIDDLNESTGTISFEAASDARQCQIYRTDFKGGPCVPLTHSIGIHHAQFSRDDSVYADTFSLSDGETGTDLFSNATGFRIARIPSLAILAATPPNVQFYHVGLSQVFDAAVVFPTNFDKTLRYPVLLRVGPVLGAGSVTTAVSNFYDSQWLADQGFIVVHIDGRGTPDRGQDNEEAVKDDFGDVTVHDQVNALLGLEKIIPALDPNHVSVLGQGIGGAVALLLVARNPETFNCAAVVAPVTDWSLLETAFAERYLGLPSFDPIGYKSSSPINYTEQIQRPVLLIQPSSPDDFGFNGSLKFAEVVSGAGKTCDFVPLLSSQSDPDRLTAGVSVHTRILQFLQSYGQR
jgi:dipeptidyl-peptidase-4